MFNFRLVWLTLLATGSGLRFVLDPVFYQWHYPGSLKGVIWFPGFPGIVSSSTPSPGPSSMVF